MFFILSSDLLALSGVYVRKRKREREHVGERGGEKKREEEETSVRGGE